MKERTEAIIATLCITVLLALPLVVSKPILAIANAEETKEETTEETDGSWYMLEEQVLPGGLGGYKKDGITVYRLVYKPTRVMYTFITTEGDRHFGNGSAVGGVALTEMTDPTTGKPLLYEGDFK